MSKAKLISYTLNDFSTEIEMESFLHFMEKSGYFTFLNKGKQAKYALGVVNQQTLIALIGKPHCKDQKKNPSDQFNQ